MMLPKQILSIRLFNHQLTTRGFRDPKNLVAWFGAMQAQDYPSSKWAIGTRIENYTSQKIEHAIAKGELVRSWVMRGTLHITSTEDIGWMLDLLAPRIIQASAGRNRQLELDDSTFHKSHGLLWKKLQGGQSYTRNELAEIYEGVGISPKGQRLYHMLHRAALEKLICFGPLKEKQQTFVLFDNHVKTSSEKSRGEALNELAKRYFQSHGPATLNDFTWWSGLTKTDARKGLESIKTLLQNETIDGEAYYFSSFEEKSPDANETTFLLPAFDEYVIAYRDRKAMLTGKNSRQVISTNGIFYPVIVYRGEVIGTWRRTIKKNQVIVELKPFEKLTKLQASGITQTAESFAGFVEKSLVLL